MLQHFFQHIREMAALGAIAIEVFAFIAHRLHGLIEEIFGFLNLVSNFGEVGHFKWGAIFLNEHHQRNPIKDQFIFFQIKAILRKVIRLIYEIKVFIVYHLVES
jgi:hypothetical protein